MELTCPACGARYRIGDDLAPRDGRLVRCSNCRAEWRVRREPSRALSAAARAPDPVAAGPVPPEPRRAPVDAFARAANPPVAAPVAAAAPARPAPTSEAMAASLQEEAGGRGRGAFMAGFAVVTLLALAGVGVYARHDVVAQAVPQLAQPLARYVALVDQARAALADLVGRALN